jgi:PAS domain S-box-containing protein
MGMKLDTDSQMERVSAGADVEATDLISLVDHRESVHVNEKVGVVYKAFAERRCEYMAVLDGDKFKGLCSRGQVGYLLGSRYGYSLFSEKPIGSHTMKQALVIRSGTPMLTVLQVALTRTGEQFYDDMALVDLDDVFLGIISVRTLVHLQSRIMLERITLTQRQKRELERKNQELFRSVNELRRSQGRYSILLENTVLGVALLNVRGGIEAMNHRLQSLIVPDHAPAPSNLADLVVLEERENFLGLLQNMERGGTGASVVEFRLELPHSGVRLFKFSTGWIRETGQICICLDDITEEKRIEQERTLLASAMHQAAEMILITDAKGDIVYVNPAFEKNTGYKRAEVIGRNPRILKSNKQNPEFYRHMWRVLLAGEVWHGRVVNRKKDGALYEEDATISPVFNAAGRIINYVAVKLDVTREVGMEMQLRQSQKMESVGTLAGGVAHEINNPINGIMNYAQLIADQLPSEDALQKYTANIMKETNRVAQIVRNLLAYARQDKQGRSPANLNDIIQAVLTLIQTVVRHDQITLTVDVPEGLPQMECRSQQIEQVLVNLLTNARDALNEKYASYHENKVIRITAMHFERDGQGWIRTTIEDHANGIPEGVRDRVFDPFYTTKPVGKGTGLGLSISYGIVKDHGGVLHFETEAGQGTRFHMDLPVKTAA